MLNFFLSPSAISFSSNRIIRNYFYVYTLASVRELNATLSANFVGLKNGRPRFHKQYARVEQSPISKWLLNEAWSFLPRQFRDLCQPVISRVGPARIFNRALIAAYRSPELIQKWINSNTIFSTASYYCSKKNSFKNSTRDL